MWSNSEYILKIKLAGLSDGSDELCETENGVHDDTKDFSLCYWKDKVPIIEMGRLKELKVWEKYQKLDLCQLI